MMELKQLQSFVVSVDTGSLSHAAKTLYTTQSHISKTIKSLEKELDMELLIRTPNGVTVTENGKQVYEHARKMLASMHSISYLAQEQGITRLSMSSMPSRELARMFADFFKAQATELTVEFQEGALEEVLHQVSHHQVGLGFIFVSDYQRQALENILHHKKLEFHPLKETRLVLYVGPQNPYYERTSVSFTELQRLHYVQNREEDISLIWHTGHLQGNLLDPKSPRVAALVSSDHAMMQLLRQTSLANLSCQLRTTVTEESAALHAVAIQESDSMIQFGYVIRTEHPLNTNESAFISYLQTQLREE